MQEVKEITECKAVEQFVIEEFAKYDIAATNLMGIMVFKDCTPKEWAETAAKLATYSPQSESDKRDCFDFILDIGKKIPMFMWDDLTLCVSFGGYSRMDIACPLFTDWLTAIIKYIVENDSIAGFQFRPQVV